VTIKPVDIRNAVASGVALFAASLVVGEYPFIGLPLAAFALGWLCYRFGWQVAVVASIVVTLGLVLAVRGLDVGALGDAAFLVGALLVAGPGTALALKRWSAVRVSVVLTLVLVTLAIVPIAVSAAQHHRSITAEVTQQVNGAIDVAASASLAQPNADAASIRAGVDLVRTWMVRLMPAYIFSVMALAAVLAVAAVSWVGRLTGTSVSSLPPLHELDLSFHLVWPSIAGLGLLAAGASRTKPTVCSRRSV
jgi:hypothetical protein